MEKKYYITGTQMVYRMPREVDHHSAEAISCEMDRMIENHGVRTLIMDFSDTDFMDSSGVGVVIGRSRLIHFFDGKICVLNWSERILRMFRASGLHKIVSIEMEKEQNAVE